MRTLKIYLKQVLQLSLFAIIISLMLGCSKQLTRDEAEKQIKQKFQLPHPELKDFPLSMDAGLAIEWSCPAQKQNWIDGHIQDKLPYLLELENEGLIKYIIDKTAVETYKEYNLKYYPRQDEMNGTRYHYYHTISYTDNGKQYASNNGSSVRVATIEFGEITGIVERKEMNLAEVNYTERRKDITPFGKALNVNEETFNKTATFTKYDNGWRIGN